MGDANASLDPDIAILRDSPALILRAGVSSLANPVNLVADGFDDDPLVTEGPLFSGNTIAVENISAGGPVILSAPGTVATRDINGGKIEIDSTTRSAIVGGSLTSGSTVDIQAGDNIILTDDIVPGNINGGISLSSVGGNIETRSIDLGTAGNIDIVARQNVNSRGELRGVAVNVTSNSGSLSVGDSTATQNITLNAAGDLNIGNLNAATVTASSINGDVAAGNIVTPGDVRISAGQTISTGNIINPLPPNLVNPIPTISLNAQNNLSVTSIDTPSANIALRATNQLSSTGNIQGLAVDLNSDAGNIAIGNINASGIVNIIARNNITGGDLLGGLVNVNSASGNILLGRGTATTSLVNLTASGNVNSGDLRGVEVNVNSDGGRIAIGNTDATIGNVSLTAPLDITSGNLRGVGVNVNSNSGRLAIGNTDATTGNVNLAAPLGVSAGNLQGVAVDVTSNRGRVETGNINAAEIVNILAAGDSNIDVTIGRINVNPAGSAIAPTVTINAQNDIVVLSVNAPGGNITITTPDLIRVTDSFINPNGATVSLSTVGGNQPGSISIRHGGGNRNPQIPFIEGDARVNGTAAGIASNSANIIPPTPPTPTQLRRRTPTSNSDANSNIQL
ncbi:MAG: DUF4097 domain-containing protein, partial [Oscillatoriales cyanobacterium RU_3_3]|nr:DUF4097 domain-containing protein [Oscillatoriales cyanobacterium RU_3_3]